MGWLSLALMTVVCIVSIYLISKGVEILLRGMKSSGPKRSYDLLLGVALLLPGLATAFLAYFLLFPGFLN